MKKHFSHASVVANAGGDICASRQQCWPDSCRAVTEKNYVCSHQAPYKKLLSHFFLKYLTNMIQG